MFFTHFFPSNLDCGGKRILNAIIIPSGTPLLDSRGFTSLNFPKILNENANLREVYDCIKRANNINKKKIIIIASYTILSKCNQNKNFFQKKIVQLEF